MSKRSGRIPFGSTCYCCGSAEKVERHHLDWHHDNDVRENVVLLCQRCHAIAHNAGVNGWDVLERVRVAVLAREPQRFKHREPGGQRSLF